MKGMPASQRAQPTPARAASDRLALADGFSHRPGRVGLLLFRRYELVAFAVDVYYLYLVVIP